MTGKPATIHGSLAGPAERLNFQARNRNPTTHH